MLKRLTRIRKVSLQRADPQELRLLPSLVSPVHFSAALLAATRVNSASFRRVMSRHQPYWASVRNEQELSAAGPIHGQRGQGRQQGDRQSDQGGQNQNR